MSTTMTKRDEPGWEASRGISAAGRFLSSPCLTHETLDAIFEAAPTPMAYLDRGLNFVRVNPAYATATGRTSAAFPGRYYFALYPDTERAALFRWSRDTGETCSGDGRSFAFPAGPGQGIVYWDW